MSNGPRRAPTSARLQRQARQQRTAYVLMALVVIFIVVVLAVSALFQFVIGPATPVATVNGQVIRADTYNRYLGFSYDNLLNQQNSIQNQLRTFTRTPAIAAANVQATSVYSSDLQTLANDINSYQAYTLSSMEQSLELAQNAKSKLHLVPTTSQIDREMATLTKQLGGATQLTALSRGTGVTVADLRLFYANPNALQKLLTSYYNARTPAAAVAPYTQHEAKAKHILVALTNKKLAATIVAQLKKGASFAALALKYSIDPGSKSIGGALRDPSDTSKTAASQPGWLTPQTSFVAPVLTAALTMKVGEIRVVQSQYGWHIIQAMATREHQLTPAARKTIAATNKATRDQAIQTKVQNWEKSVSGAKANKVTPPNPYTQFQPATPTPS